jgi:hypothetical protein
MTTTTTTQAEQVAAILGNDGLVFAAEDGRRLEDLCARATITKARTRFDSETDRETVEEVSRGEQIFDRIRYTFSDGSAIVVAGDAWDIEGDEPFSWAGA